MMPSEETRSSCTLSQGHLGLYRVESRLTPGLTDRTDVVFKALGVQPSEYAGLPVLFTG